MNARSLVGFAVTLVWAGCALTSVITHDALPLEVVSPVMLVYAGWLFGARGLLKNGPKKNGE